MASKDKKQQVIPVTRVLEEVLKRINSGAKDVTYGELAKALGCEPRDYPLFLALGRIQCLCAGLRLPCLPVVVVRKADHVPGKGFYDLHDECFYKLSKLPGTRAEEILRDQQEVRDMDAESWKPLIEAAMIADTCDDAIA